MHPPVKTVHCASVSITLSLLACLWQSNAEDLSLTAEQAVEFAVKNNRSLQALDHQLSAADIGVKSAVTGFLPQASLSSTYTRKSGNDMFSKFLGSSLKNSYSIGIDIQQPVFSGFATFNSLRSAQTSRALQQVTNEKNAQTIRYAVLQIYWGIMNLQKSEAVATEAVRQLEELTANQQALLEQGMTTEHDYLLTDASLAQARMNLVEVTATADAMMRQFAVLLGLPVTTKITLADTAALPVVTVNDVDSTVAWALKNRPDLREGALQLQLSDLGVKQTRSALFPAVVAGYSWSSSRPDQTLRDQWGGDWSAYVSLNFTLFKWGDRYFKVKKAKEEYRARSLLQEEKKNTVEKEVRDASQKVTWSAQALETARQLAAAREKSYEASRAKHEEGMIPMYELLDAHSTLVSAKYKVLQAATDLELAIINRSMAGLGSGDPAAGGTQ